LAGRITLLALLTGPSDGVGFIVDRIDETVTAAFIVRVQDLPSKYLPQQHARHDPSLRPAWSSAPQSFLLDADWDAKLLARIEQKYLDVFAFTYFTHQGSADRLPPHILRYDYDGGFPYVHAFGQIRSSVPRESRAKSVGVSAHSPGVLTIDAPTVVADRLAAALGMLPQTLNAYRAVHAWSKLKPAHVGKLPPMDVVLADIRRLSGLLSVDPLKLLPEAGGQLVDPTHLLASVKLADPLHVLASGKLLASYWRKLVELLYRPDGFEFLLPGLPVPDEQTFDAAEEDDEYLVFGEDDEF
jgi:hypothetical protein